ncbi:MAG: hypothetical protein Q4F80_06760 [bacterium]|nr:hypothetical protein [bacterium]
MLRKFRYHSKQTETTCEECNTDKELSNINNKSKTLLDSINKYSETLKQLREEVKRIEKNTVKEEGTVTGGASNINNKTGRKAVTPKERLYMEAGKIVSPFFKLAGANLQDAVNNFKYAKENKHAYVLDSRDEVKNAEINKILDDIKVPKDSRGVYYDINSEESKALWKTNEIQNILKENYDKLKNNEKKLSINVNFTNKGDFDAHLALQHCKLINPKITSDGYFEGIIVDYYDFNYRTPEIKTKDIKNMHDIKDWAVNEANNWGYSMQKNSSI